MPQEPLVSELPLLKICCLVVFVCVQSTVVQVPEEARRKLQIPRVRVKVGCEPLGRVLAT